MNFWEYGIGMMYYAKQHSICVQALVRVNKGQITLLMLLTLGMNTAR